MSKAIVVLDMPNSCSECEILDNDELTCMGMKVEYGNLNTRQYFCPLKPLPSNLDWSTINQCVNTDSLEYGRCVGRQELIDEILGEEEI